MAITLDGTTGITASGNITGNYILGNGSQLSGIITSVSSLSNGTSNVAVTSSGGNVTVGVGGTPNVAVFTATGANISGTFNVTGNTALANVLIATSKSIDVGNNRIMNVAEPVANTDAVTKSYVDSITSSGFTVQDDTANTTVVSAGDTLVLSGTANEVTVSITAADTVTFGLPDSVSVTGNITANYFLGNGSQLTGIDATAIQNGTSNVRVAASGNVTVSSAGTANVLTVTSTGANIAGTLNATGNANVGNLGATNITGTLTTAAQTNITSVGNLTSLDVTGNVSTGNVSGATGTFTNVVGTLTTATQTNITSVGTLTSLSVTGNVSAGNLTVSTGTVSVGNIENTNANGVGNIGTATNYFNTVFAQATSAQYADLAEYYTADADYAPGTVVIFGGEKEITVTATRADARVVGAVSTNPAYLMNAQSPGVAVALRGRIPVNVVGPVTKGDSLVTSQTPGFAESIGTDCTYGQSVFAKSLETNLEPGKKTVEALIL